MSVKIYSHNPHSEGARQLATTLGVRRLRHDGTRWTPRRGDVVVNWGSSRLPDFQPATVINSQAAIGVCSNKLSFFQVMGAYHNEGERPRVPEWTRDRAVAATWFDREDSKVVCRTILTGHSGNGIIIAESENELADAPLYTRYVKKQAEYRVHIVRSRQGGLGSRIIDVQRKIRDPEREPTDWRVRSHANGFIFVRSGFELPADAETQTLRAFRASGLDFGAVDVIYNEREGQAYVLEINTAPGLTGTTVDNYAEAFRREFF